MQINFALSGWEINLYCQKRHFEAVVDEEIFLHSICLKTHCPGCAVWTTFQVSLYYFFILTYTYNQKSKLFKNW